LTTKNFTVEIPNERLKTYKLVTFIILSLNFFGFGFVFLKTAGTDSYLAIFLLVLNAVPWSYYLLNKKHIKSPIVEITFMASAAAWMYFGNIWMGIFLLAFTLIGFVANKKSVIYFSDEGIVYPSFPTKKYAWNEVQQVLWKDDVLTIDLKNNTLMQFNIEKEFAISFDFPLFNQWCSQKIFS
jgi:hypothetical protein